MFCFEKWQENQKRIDFVAFNTRIRYLVYELGVDFIFNIALNFAKTFQMVEI